MNNLNSLETHWHYQLSLALADLNLECQFFYIDEFKILSLPDHFFAIHLVDQNNAFQPESLIALQLKYQQQNIRLVHLWEDIWCNRSQQVISRIKSLTGQNQRIHGRKTSVRKITKPESDQFLNDNHIQGAVLSRYKYGLFEKQQLVAVATFSALRKMNHTENYRSAELIRFAVKAGFSISGGLSKLIAHFVKEYQPNDIMTYADRDWSSGKAYEKLGFIQSSELAPQYFSINHFSGRALIKNPIFEYPHAFNTGSIKYLLKL